MHDQHDTKTISETVDRPQVCEKAGSLPFLDLERELEMHLSRAEGLVQQLGLPARLTAIQAECGRERARRQKFEREAKQWHVEYVLLRSEMVRLRNKHEVLANFIDECHKNSGEHLPEAIAVAMEEVFPSSPTVAAAPRRRRRVVISPSPTVADTFLVRLVAEILHLLACEACHDGAVSTSMVTVEEIASRLRPAGALDVSVGWTRVALYWVAFFSAHVVIYDPQGSAVGVRGLRWYADEEVRALRNPV